MVNDLQKLIDAIQRDFVTPPTKAEPEWASPALNVIDCVLSLNRKYEGFVRPRVEKFMTAYPTVQSLEGLRETMDSYPSPRDFSVACLNYDDAARARILRDVVEFLLDVQNDFEGTTEAERLRRWAEDARPGDFAFTGVKGFGLSGFQYLRIMCGADTAKPDVHVQGFVSDAVGRKVTDVEALYLLQRAAKRLGYRLGDLDHAIWESRAHS